MLRRVARALRRLLLGAGLALVLLLPFTFLYTGGISQVRASGLWLGGWSWGVVHLTVLKGDMASTSSGYSVEIRRTPEKHLRLHRSLWKPLLRNERYIFQMSIPVWLLAALCLAWPVTSLLLARRRRKGRGFAVEPAADAAPPAIDPARYNYRREEAGL